MITAAMERILPLELEESTAVEVAATLQQSSECRIERSLRSLNELSDEN